MVLTNLSKYDIINISSKEREVITMKINFVNEIGGTPIKNVAVGETFIAQRTYIKERGLYMKIDGNSGLIQKKRGCSYAINLASGQLREFQSDVCVDKILTEVNFPKK